MNVDISIKNTNDGRKLVVIAFFLPQFYPTPENDIWWGKGFTEWTNVTVAKPLFNGHLQPNLPRDLGFYDLRVRDTRRAQIEIAKQYGISGFCYYYYWFSGKRLLDHPIDDMLRDPASDMPFCLCWANESWTRRWDAADHEVLMPQKYLPDDDEKFIASLHPFFSDKRYIRIDGKPLLIVYRPQELPEARQSAKIWREYCRASDIGEIHLCAALTHGNLQYRQFGFDSGVEFPPHNHNTRSVNKNISFFSSYHGNVVKYAELANSFINRQYKEELIFRTVFPCWDNTARKKDRSFIVINGNPDNYEHWLSSTIDSVTSDRYNKDSLIFVNAWNEWAEGCHLEPDQYYGRGFLEATSNAIAGVRRFSGFPHNDMPITVGFERKGFSEDCLDTITYYLAQLSGKVRLAIARRPGFRDALIVVNRYINLLHAAMRALFGKR